jgi:hypothetical protein
MSRLSDEKTLELLRGAMRAYNLDGPPGDLWPRVRHRIDRANRPPAADWVVAAALVLLCLLRPSLVGLLLLHF